MEAGIALRVLGPLEVSESGRDVAPRAAKPRRLLLCLAVDAGRVVSVDRLVDALWGETPPRSAANLLQVYVWKLRGSLGDDVIETVPGGYRLALGDSFFDARVFEALLADGRRALTASNPELALALLQRALQLWRGDAYVDAADADFAAGEARRLEDLRLLCLEDCLDSQLALGRHEQVLGEVRALATAHPLRERPRKQLIISLYRAGRHAEALDEYREFRRTLSEQLGLEPSNDLKAVERAVLRHDEVLASPPAVVQSTARRTLPTPPTSLIGRERELHELWEIVARPDVRLLTIAGAGGSGKTRLAIALAERCLEEFANGVAFVELAPIRDPGRVIAAIAESLGLTADAEGPVEVAVAEWLEEREILLVIDNLEHLTEAAVALASLVARARRLTIVVTSRKVLHVSGEYVYPLQPLELDSAVQLFAARAEAAASPLDADAVGSVREICRRLDGLPLAIELAAARTAALTPQEILERLEPRLALLTGGPRDLPARQQTLRATIRWSTDLVGPTEQSVLARLAVFAGGWTVDAAAAIADATLEDLHSLLGHSLIARPERETRTRLTMLETIRDYALELLEAKGDLEATARRHARYYAELVSAPEPEGRAQRERLAVVGEDFDNLRAAMDWAESDGDHTLALRLATGLYRHWYVRGLFAEGSSRIERPLDLGVGDDELRALALRALAGLRFLLGDLEGSERRAREGIEIGERAGTIGASGACHTVLGLIAKERGDYAAARLHFQQSDDIAHETENSDGVVVANNNLAELAFARNDLEEARRRWQKSVATNDKRGDPDANGIPLLGLGAVALAGRDLAAARTAFETALDISRRWNARHNEASALLGLAAVAHAMNETEKSAKFLISAQTLFERMHSPPMGSDADTYDRILHRLRETVGDEHLEALANAERDRQENGTG